MNTTDDTAESQDTYPNAGRDSGYVAPVGEDLVNKLTILVSAIETKLLLQGQETRNDIATLAKESAQVQAQVKGVRDDGEHRQSYLLREFAALRRGIDAQLDGTAKVLSGDVGAIAADIKNLAASVEGAAQLAGKAIALAEEVAVGQTALAGVVSDQGEKIDAIDSRLQMVEVTPGTYPDLLQGMQHLEKAVAAIGQRSDRRQGYLLIAIGSVVLVLLILIVIQISGA